MTSVDFGDAAQRHWDDAELLRTQERWPNADQLYGLSAECSLKALMKALGMPLRSDDSPPRKYRLHIDELWGAFRSFAKGKGASAYASMLPAANPFGDWKVGQRYWRSEKIREGQVRPHRRGVERVRDMLGRARLDGRIS